MDHNSAPDVAVAAFCFGRRSNAGPQRARVSRLSIRLALMNHSLRNDALPPSSAAGLSGPAAAAQPGGDVQVAGELQQAAGEAAPPTELQRASLPKIIPFATLARCGEEIWIENEGQIYRLRKTRQGKLILTK